MPRAHESVVLCKTSGGAEAMLYIYIYMWESVFMFPPLGPRPFRLGVRGHNPVS